jgi:hypothetical protein
VSSRAYLKDNPTVRFDVVRQDEYGDYVVVFDKVTPEYTLPGWLVVRDEPVYSKGDIVKNYLGVVVLVTEDVYGDSGVGLFIRSLNPKFAAYSLGEIYTFTVLGSELIYHETGEGV